LHDDESAAQRPLDGDSASVAADAPPRTPTYVASGLVECGEVISSSETLSVYRISRTTERMQEVILTFSQRMRNEVAAGSDNGGLHFGRYRWD